MLHVERIRAAVERLNWRHGWGDVGAVRMFLDGRVEVDIVSRYRRGVTRTARLVGAGSVRFARHQIKIPA